MPFPLLPDAPFVDGDEWTPELGYFSLNTPIFDDQVYLGHRPRITDGELSNVAGALKPRVAAIESALKVSVSTGLTLSYSSGTVTLPSGVALQIAASLVVAPNNAVSFVYVDPLGNVVCDLVPTVVRLLLAKVTTVAGVVTALDDLRHPSVRPIQPTAASVKVFGGNNATDKVCTAGEVFNLGFYYFRNFTVPPGITINIDKFCRIFCSGTVDIGGTVSVSQITAGASAFTIGAVSGVNAGGQNGVGIGAGGGGAVMASQPYPFGAQQYGSSGGAGFVGGNNAVVTMGAAGNGGGCFWLEAAGPILIRSSAYINAVGTGGANNSLVSTTAGWLLVATGSGGGSGGLIYLSSLVSNTVEAGAVLDIRGGTGGAGLATAASGNFRAGGGGGGGGGYIVLSSPLNNSTGATLSMNGGNVGANGDFGSPSSSTLVGAGGGGYGGAGGNSAIGGLGQLVLRTFSPIGS